MAQDEAGGIVLVGGGHAHVLALLDLAAAGLGAAVTLVSPQRLTPYSGMLPGHIAGLYRHDEIHIDLDALCRRTGATWRKAAAAGLDRPNRAVLLADGERVPYRVASIDVGIEPDLSAIAGAAEHAVPVKPIAGLLPRLDALRAAVREGTGQTRIVVVGGGAAGVELALALQARLRSDLKDGGGSGRGVHTRLVASSGLVPTLAPRARRLAAEALARAGVDVADGRRVVAIGADHVELDDGERFAADFAIVSTTARAPAWLATLGLPVAPDGALVVGPTLQCEGEAAVLAAGDCAFMAHAPREKAGVFAVRQGPVIAANLAAAMRGDVLQPFMPQERFLVLLSTADGHAIAARGNLAYAGRPAWWLKDWIDRRFMARFRA